MFPESTLSASVCWALPTQLGGGGDRWGWRASITSPPSCCLGPQGGRRYQALRHLPHGHRLRLCGTLQPVCVPEGAGATLPARVACAAQRRTHRHPCAPGARTRAWPAHDPLRSPHSPALSSPCRPPTPSRTAVFTEAAGPPPGCPEIFKPYPQGQGRKELHWAVSRNLAWTLGAGRDPPRRPQLPL